MVWARPYKKSDEFHTVPVSKCELLICYLGFESFLFLIIECVTVGTKILKS